MKTEKIITFWRIGYMKLYEHDIYGYEYTQDEHGNEWEWRNLFWRIYWRTN